MTNSRQMCPICSQTAFSFRGPEKSPYLILAEAPTTDDHVKCLALSGGSGWIMRNELDRQNCDFASYRVGFMLWHEMKSEKESEGCRIASIENAIREAQGKRAIMLLGAKTVKYFTGLSVDTVSSLRVRSQYLKCENILAGVSPNAALSRTIGETRLICLRWSEMLNEIDEQRRQAFIKAYDVKE
jgi:hypothetical protein